MTKNCPMRHENGNCIPVGGFCTANKNICEALHNAYRMGKAQLSQEGATSDLISRQAAIDELRKFKPEIIPYEKARIYVEKTVKTMYDRIVELPTVQPERKKGEWIEISSINHTYKCSECGRLLVNVTDGKNNVSKHYPYCHCGADMKGGSNE